METRREAENNYQQAKQLEKEGHHRDAFWVMRRAANGRHARAAYEMGKFYEEGIYTKKNYRIARHYYFIAAYEGDIKYAYISLAEIDFYGKGRSPAIELGYKWMLVGTRGDSKLQDKMRLKMDPEMTVKGMANAQKSASSWMRSRKLDEKSDAAE